MRLTLYTKKNCHLCEIMEEVIHSLEEEFEFEYESVDIESNGELNEKYKEKVPVLLVNDRIFAKYRIEKDKLAKRLQSEVSEL